MLKGEDGRISSPSGPRSATRIAYRGGWRRALCQRPRLVPRRSLSGQVMLLVAISLVVLLGLAGLATDAGILWTEKRQMQSAVDAAAVAGVLAVDRSSDVTAAAKMDAGVNGFTDGTSGVVLTVNNPPVSGSYAGDPRHR